MKSIVTRSGQITLVKEMREELDIDTGTPVEVNKSGTTIVVKKISAEVWDKVGNFLPRDFKSVLKEIRTDEEKRLKRLGVIAA